MKSFNEYVDKKTREAKRQLGLIKKILEKNGDNIGDFLDGEEPYLYLKNSGKQLSFDGVRIYKIGNNLAYRVQKEDKTHPYGKSYSLDLEEMYNDLVSDDYKEIKAGEVVMKAVAKEFKDFFDQSVSAEKQLRELEFDKKQDPMGRVIVKSTGTDYSDKVQSTKGY